jgi:hypothetical protein
MICRELDHLYNRLDLAGIIKGSGKDFSAKEMRLMWEIQAHTSHGHDGEPCPGDFALIHNRRL